MDMENNGIVHWSDYSFPGTKYNKKITEGMLEEEGDLVLRSRKHSDPKTVQYDESYILNKLGYEMFSRIPSMSLKDWQSLVAKAYENFQEGGGVLL